MNTSSNTKYSKFGEEDSIELTRSRIKFGKNDREASHHSSLSQSQRPTSKLWIVTGILGGVSFGIANLFKGTTPRNKVYSQEIIMVGSFVITLAYLVYEAIESKQHHGYYWKWENSTFKSRFSNGIRWSVLIMSTLLAASIFAAGILILYAFQYALEAEMNQGIVSTLFAMCSIYLAIVFWILYKQKLSLYDFIGMVSLVACAILIVFSQPPIDPSMLIPEHKKRISPFWSVLFAILATLVFLVKCLIQKYGNENLGLKPIDITINALIVGGIVFLVFIIVNIAIYGLNFPLYRDSILAGIFDGLGNIFGTHAIVTGLGGPASALANLQVIVQIILDIIILGQIPNFLQILSCIVGIFGATAISMGPFIQEKIIERYRS